MTFADETKVFRKVTNDTDNRYKVYMTIYINKLNVQNNCNILSNSGKCKCIHIGHGNTDEEYKMGDAVLDRTTQGNDLGVGNIGSWSEH